MKTLLTTLFLSIAGLSVCQQRDGTLLELSPVILPPYDSVKGIAWYYGRSEYEEARNDTSIKIMKQWYYSDGLKVAAFVIGPENIKTKYPLIIYNRGGSVRNDIAFAHAPLFKKLVRNGFVVIAPALRQSEGSEGKDEVGGADIHDVLNIENVYSQLSYVDTVNVFMLGESRGGIMTFLALKAGMKISAAVTVGAITDVDAYLRDNTWINPLQIWPDYATNRVAILSSRSALKWPDQLRVPLLIMNGADDPQVKPYHSLQLASRLSDLGRTYQLKIFANGNHILSGVDTDERDRETIAWFGKFMK